jgi:hypothetical protein
MIMNKLLKSSLAFMVAILIAGAISPTISAYAASNENENLKQNNTNDQQEAQELQKVIQDNNITEKDLINGLNKNLGNRSQVIATQNNNLIQPMGIKSKAAKEAAKAMIKKLKKIGQKAWDKAVKKTVDGLPIPTKYKKVIIKYMGYKGTMTVLNIMTGISDSAQNALTSALKKVGVPGWLADIISRAVTTILM